MSEAVGHSQWEPGARVRVRDSADQPCAGTEGEVLHATIDGAWVLHDDGRECAHLGHELVRIVMGEEAIVRVIAEALALGHVSGGRVEYRDEWRQLPSFEARVGRERDNATVVVDALRKAGLLSQLSQSPTPVRSDADALGPESLSN